MTIVPAGLLLPQSTLSSHWFHVLATFVAFNTIIYLGLTVSKLIPWPRQFHPSRVRSLLATFAFLRPPEAKVPENQDFDTAKTDSPYDALRKEIARKDIPQAFAFMGGLTVLLALATYVSFASQDYAAVVGELAVGLAFLIVAQILARRPFRGRTMMWTWAVGSSMLVAGAWLEGYQRSSQVPLAYSLIVMTAFAPICMSWRPSLTAGAFMLTGSIIAAFTVPGAEDARLIAAAVAALLVSFVLLQLRLSSVDEISDERRRAFALATTDLLTGNLSRQGLLTLLPGLASVAERTGQHVCIMAFDIDDLARANTDYGVAYGDEVIRAVSQAINATVRRGDLVARWDGDAFVVAGLGNQPSADALADRIAAAVHDTGVNLGKWPVEVTVATAADDPTQTTFDALLAQAQPGRPVTS